MEGSVAPNNLGHPMIIITGKKMERGFTRVKRIEFGLTSNKLETDKKNL
jgi:hypothetical protein